MRLVLLVLVAILGLGIGFSSIVGALVPSAMVRAPTAVDVAVVLICLLPMCMLVADQTE